MSQSPALDHHSFLLPVAASCVAATELGPRLNVRQRARRALCGLRRVGMHGGYGRRPCARGGDRAARGASPTLSPGSAAGACRTRPRLGGRVRREREGWGERGGGECARVARGGGGRRGGGGVAGVATLKRWSHRLRSSPALCHGPQISASPCTNGTPRSWSRGRAESSTGRRSFTTMARSTQGHKRAKTSG
jgi:hypothetical protein